MKTCINSAVLFCVLVCLPCLRHCAAGEVAPYVELPAKVKGCDLCFAAAVLGDHVSMPAAPDPQRAHRTVTVRPLLALKGALPGGPVSIKYFPAEARIDDRGEVLGWSQQYTYRLFQPGGVYFFCVNAADGSLVLRDTPECCFVLDDPLGEGRTSVVEAFKKAGAALPGEWQTKLDDAAGKLLSDFIPPFGQWVAKGNLIACLRVKTTKVSRVEEDVARANVPKGLHDLLVGNPDKSESCFIARNWHSLQHRRLTWTKEGLPLLAFLQKQEPKSYYVLEVVGTLLEESIPLTDRPHKTEDVTIRLAWALDEPPVKSYSSGLVGGAVIMVPVTEGAEASSYQACGQPLLPDKNRALQLVRDLRSLSARLRQMRFLDALISAKTVPGEADRRIAGMLLGKAFSGDDRGYDDLAIYWSGLRPDFAGPLEAANPAIMGGQDVRAGK